MAASILKSERAITIMQHVVSVFVRSRKIELGAPSSSAVVTSSSAGGALSQRLQSTIERLMDAIVDHENQRTVRDEAKDVLKQSINHIKSKLDKAGFENDEIAARAAKLLSEAEANKASAAKTKAEAHEICLRILTKKLRMVLETEQAIARGEIEGFLRVLDDLSKV